MPEAAKIAAIRDLLPATAAGIYLNAGTAGPLPAEVKRAMDEQAERELAIGRAHADLWPDTLERMAEARASVAAALVADPGDIALTHSTTDGMNLAVGSLPWRPGDRVVSTTREHAGGLGALFAVRDRLGVEVELVDLGDEGDDDAALAALGRALERPARAVVLSHVPFATGALLPIARIGALARAAGAVTIVDGAQAAGAIPLAVEELGIDAYALPAQKWLLGPEGMGALWVRRELAVSTDPIVGGWLSYASFDPAGHGRRHAGARRFEATGFHRPSVVGFARAVGWLTMYVGLPWSQDRAARLAGGLADRLAAIPGVTLVTPRGRMATLVSFRIAGWPAGSAAAELGARVFAIVREVAEVQAIRASVGFWNTEPELDRFAEAVELLARHTPDTIPPRRTLALLGDEGPLR
jgi:L-cysteine/cystine lyase